jgi:hypothetical protein
MVIVPSVAVVRAPFSSTHTLAKVLIALFLVAATIDAIGAYSDFLQADLISSMLIELEQLSFEPAATEEYGSFQDVAYDKQSKEEIGRVSVQDSAGTYEEAAQLNDDRQVFIGMLQLIWLPVIALFLIWFYKVYRNLSTLGVMELSSSARMAAVYFFIPLVSMFKPYTAAVEIWKGSKPGVDSTTSAYRKAMKSPGLLKLWWVFWVATGIMSFYLLRYDSTITDESSVDSFVYLSWTLFIADTISAVTAILTALVVRKIDKMQQEKSRWIMPSDTIAS